MILSVGSTLETVLIPGRVGLGAAQGQVEVRLTMHSRSQKLKTTLDYPFGGYSMSAYATKVAGLLCLVVGLFCSGGCLSNNAEVKASEPAITATLLWQEATGEPRTQVLVRVPHYRVLTGHASILGRRYYGSTVLKPKAATPHEDWKNRHLGGVVGDDVSLCDIYFVVDRIEPVMAADIYLRTEVSCKVILSGFAGQLREKGTNVKHDGPFVFDPGTYHLETTRGN